MERKRNPRGSGQHLRDEILAAARGLLAETGSEDAITLRAVAREAEVAAPSIYDHFPSSRAIVDAIVAAAFDELSATLRAAGDATAQAPKAARLAALCSAYLDFAADDPHRYRILFGRTRSSDEISDGSSSESLALPQGRIAFEILVDSVADLLAARGLDADPSMEAVMVWSALHGHALLRASFSYVRWPLQDDAFCRTLVARVGCSP